MKSVIRRANFQHWLDNGTAPLVVAHSQGEAVTVLKLAKAPEIDYLYGTTTYHAGSISWRDTLGFCGVYDQRNGKLYLADAPLTALVDGITEDERQGTDAYAKEISDAVNQRVEAEIANDRNNLSVAEITGWQASRDLEYYLEHGVREDAVRRLFSDEAPDGQFHSEYRLSELPEAAFIAYIADPELFIQTEAEQYIKNNQENILQQFLENDALLSEYQALMQDTENSIHRMKAITDAVRGCGAKTVTVTVQKDGEELSFKTEASYLVGQRNYYNTSGIPAQDRRRFEDAFGRHADYNAADVVKITYGRNTIYEAPAAPAQEMGPVMQMGGM